MPETIETFVAKLQAEGVEAGRQAADDLRVEAQQQAERVVKDAQQQAGKIVADAEKQAADVLARSKGELDLAARDVLLQLTESIEKALQAILKNAATARLSDSKFLAKTLHDLIVAYGKADADRQQCMRITVSPEMQAELADWAIKQLGHDEVSATRTEIDLKGTLKTAGFEYSMDGGNVEVTPDSVVEILSELVSPRLREIITSATAGGQAKE